MQTMQANNIRILWQIPLKCLLFRRLDTRLTSDRRAVLRRWPVGLDARVYVSRFDRVDDQVREAGYGVTVNEGGYGGVCWSGVVPLGG